MAIMLVLILIRILMLMTISMIDSQKWLHCIALHCNMMLNTVLVIVAVRSEGKRGVIKERGEGRTSDMM